MIRSRTIIEQALGHNIRDYSNRLIRLNSFCTMNSNVATKWTGVNMPTPLLPEVVLETDANPVRFLRGGGYTYTRAKFQLQVLLYISSNLHFFDKKRF